jgi:hypothetical protein
MLIALATALIVTFVATNQIQPQNKYMGMQKMDFGLLQVLFIVSFFCFWCIVYKQKEQTPTDIFLIVYFALHLLWFVFFSGIGGIEEPSILALNYLLLLLPPLFVWALRPMLKKFFDIIFHYTYTTTLKTEYVLILILVLVAVYMNKTMSWSYSFEDSYIRRLEGREQMSGVIAYAFPACLNTAAPLLAFLGTLKKNYLWFIFALFFSVLGYLFLGLKAPTLYVVLFGFFGLFMRRPNPQPLFMILIAVFTISVISICEYFMIGFTMIGDLFLRRAFLVPPQVQTYYIDHFVNTGSINSWIFGFSDDSQISFIIGNKYFHNPNTNANTNGFLYEIGRNGLLGYFLAIFFIATFFSFLDSFYKRTRHKVWLAVAFIYSLLLLEQSYSTAFVTSGVGFAVLILFFTNSNNRTKFKC